MTVSDADVFARSDLAPRLERDGNAFSTCSYGPDASPQTDGDGGDDE